jgi:hypothetical protein
MKSVSAAHAFRNSPWHLVEVISNIQSLGAHPQRSTKALVEEISKSRTDLANHTSRIAQQVRRELDPFPRRSPPDHPRPMTRPRPFPQIFLRTWNIRSMILVECPRVTPPFLKGIIQELGKIEELDTKQQRSSRQSAEESEKTLLGTIKLIEDLQKSAKIIAETTQVIEEVAQKNQPPGYERLHRGSPRRRKRTGLLRSSPRNSQIGRNDPE